MTKRLKVFIAVLCILIITLIFAAGCVTTQTTQPVNDVKSKMTFNFEPPWTEYEQFYDLGNYIILLKENKDVNTAAVFELLQNAKGAPVGGCSAAAKHDKNGDVIFGRNMDLPATQYPAFISENNLGKYKTLSITYLGTAFGKLSNGLTYEKLLKEGKIDDTLYDAIPVIATDALNEKGLYIQGDMRLGEEGLNNYGTNPGKPDAPQHTLPLLVTSNCANVSEAIDFIKNENNWVSYSAKTGNIEDDWNGAFMIGDSEGEFGLIEIANNNIQYLPYYPAQSNYYLAPFFTTAAEKIDGDGRLQAIYSGLSEPQTEEEMQKLLEKAYFKNYYLNLDNAYRDENGKIHFVDENGNPVYDWRGEIVSYLIGTVPVDENGLMVSETGYEDGYNAYLDAQSKGDAQKTKQYLSDYIIHKAYLDRCTPRAVYDDRNFETVQKYAIKHDKDNQISDKLKKFYAGDEEPLRNDTSGTAWIAGLNIGVNCAKKHMIVKFWENDNLVMDFTW
ncbi:MAG TPA: linear amide C-N hydrolase [Methanocorpusculum sp.]|nr:linear amide C-N hydrolase [Methanocorpusculum sp.]